MLVTYGESITPMVKCTIHLQHTLIPIFENGCSMKQTIYFLCFPGHLPFLYFVPFHSGCVSYKCTGHHKRDRGYSPLFKYTKEPSIIVNKATAHKKIFALLRKFCMHVVKFVARSNTTMYIWVLPSALTVVLHP